MSRNRSSVSLGKTLEVLLSSHPYHQQGNIVSPSDTARIANALTLWLLVLADIGEKLGLGRNFSDANLQRCAGRLVADGDISRFSNDMKTLLDRLRHYDPTMGHCSFRTYKVWFELARVPEYRDLLWPLFTYYYRSTFSVDIFRDLNTCLQFTSRLTLRDCDWQEEAALDSYLALEQDMHSWTFPSETISALRQIVTEWFDGFDIFGYRPHHSDGATAEVRRGVGVSAKMRNVRTGLSCTTYLEVATGWGVAPLSRRTLFDDFEFPDASKRQCVPKGIDKKRGIGMEPTTLQFWQHAVFDCLDDWFASHPNIRVDLHDQSHNQSRCTIGSGRCSYATIDLSNASDSVHNRLVNELCAYSRPLLSALCAARAPHVITEAGQIVQLQKYAGMGSALCFPVECIVFSAVAELACRQTGCTHDYRVYGDDIVVPSEAYDATLAILDSLHFEVNRDKSFGPYSHFLESCGMEAWFGYDVTPLRISRRWDIVKLRSSTKSPEALAGAIDFVNRCWDYGFSRVRVYLIASILEVFPRVPFAVNPREGIYHPNPSNMHLAWRRNRNLQRPEVLIEFPESCTERGPNDTSYVVTLERLALTKRESLSDPEDRIDVSTGSTRSRVVKRWIDQSLLSTEETQGGLL